MVNSPIFEYVQQFEPQILESWPRLTVQERAAFIQQIESLDIETLKKEKELALEAPNEAFCSCIEPFEEFSFSGNPENKYSGQQLIENGQLGCLLLAGGQGTRLKFHGPKGLYPISVVKNKTLFQLCAEKVKAASQLAGRPLRLAIMTSPENDLITREYFDQHAFFGLLPSQVDFFMQETLPFVDEGGNLFLEKPWKIYSGPDGNGHSLLRFYESGIWEAWTKEGINFLHVILVDNPLADPFDPELLGYHVGAQTEITVKCTEKFQAHEKVGLLVKDHQCCRIVEYSEMTEKEVTAIREDGRLKHCCANLSLFCFSMPFIQRMVLEGRSIPLHKAWKAIRKTEMGKNSLLPVEKYAWKFETFIFDWMVYANRVSALLYPRESSFAPLKNLCGVDSPDTVKAALQQADRACIQALTGLAPPDFPFELAAEFHYATPELQDRWKGQKVTTAYVEPYTIY